MGAVQRTLVFGTLALLAFAFGRELTRAPGSVGDALIAASNAWLAPFLILGLLLIGVGSRVRVYESMVSGAREGLEVASRIVPYLVAILVAVGMFRASGALDLIVETLDPLTSAVGFPAAALPMALLRPLSGSGGFAVMSETIQTHGPDSFVGMLVSTLQGSTETTFYVLTLYAGAAGVRDVRHALPACRSATSSASRPPQRRVTRSSVEPVSAAGDDRCTTACAARSSRRSARRCRRSSRWRPGSDCAASRACACARGRRRA